MSSYAFFLGCVIPIKFPGFESATRQVANKLGIELTDMDFTCCPAPSIKSLNEDSWLAIGARNIAVAEEKEQDIVTMCPGCLNTLTEVNFILNTNEDKKEKINKILKKSGRQFKGTATIKHFLELLTEEENLENLKQLITKKLPLKIGVHYGCHLLRPSEVMKRDGIEEKLDEIWQNLDFTLLDYPRKDLCCGAATGNIDMEKSHEIAKEKLDYLKEMSADALLTVCPTCFHQFDLAQVTLNRKYSANYNIPVINGTQLLALALGANPESLGFEVNKIKVDKILNEIK